MIFAFFVVDEPLPEHSACEGQELDLSCDKGKAIRITSANFGRQVGNFI